MITPDRKLPKLGAFLRFMAQLVLTILLLDAIPQVATGQYYPGRTLFPHGHTTAQDGGKIISWPHTVTFSKGISTATATVTGKLTMPAASTFTVSIPATSSGSFNLNNLTQKGLVSGFVIFSATGTLTIQNSLNVSSVTDNGAGRFRVNWAVPMNTQDYPCIVTCSYSPGVNGVCIGSLDEATVSSSQRASVTDVVTSDHSSTPTDRNRVHVICYGGAEAARHK